MSGWAVIFTPPTGWRGNAPVRPCEDQDHANTVRDTFPAQYLPAFAAVQQGGDWVQVGEARTS